MRSQFATGSQKHRDPRYFPYVFTEHGAVMLAAVLNSSIAAGASIRLVRAFVRLRSVLAAHKELPLQLDNLSLKTDANFKVVYDLIKKYLKPAPQPKSKPIKKLKIGFRTK